jgi:tripartite-type tricarboxylate transporter receptor subunit TctC
MRATTNVLVLIVIFVHAAFRLAEADEFPSRVIKLVVPGLAGGGIDIVARLIEPAMSNNLGQRVIVDDRAGGNATVGAAWVAHAAPDGYTLLISTSGPIINALGAEITYDVDTSFRPISRVMASPFFLCVPQDSTIRTVAELVAAGKDPNQIIRYGHPGPGTATHLATALLDKMANTHFVGIPYHGAAGQASDTISGQLQFGLFAAPDALSRRNSGFRILAVSSAQRSVLAPDIPTIAESGVPGYEAELWHGLFAPAQTPQPIIERVHQGLAAALHDDATRSRFLALAMVPTLDTPDDFAAIVKAQKEKDLALAKELKLKMP